MISALGVDSSTRHHLFGAQFRDQHKTARASYAQVIADASAYIS